MTEKLAHPFAEYRKVNGLTIDQFAELFEVDRTTIIRWEKGEPHIPVKRLARAEEITGISRQDLRPDIFEAAQ